MKVSKTKTITDNYSIEIGQATWDESEISIRNRYKTSNGGFSPRSSSELPIADVYHIASMAIENDLIVPKKLAVLLKEISESLNRQI